MDGNERVERGGDCSRLGIRGIGEFAHGVEGQLSSSEIREESLSGNEAVVGLEVGESGHDTSGEKILLLGDEQGVEMEVEADEDEAEV